MKVQIVDRGTMEFPTVSHDDVDLRGPGDAVAAAVRLADAQLLRAQEPEAIAAWLVVAAMGRGRLGHPYRPSPRELAALVAWMRSTTTGQPMFWLMLRLVRPDDLGAWAADLLATVPDSVAEVYGGALIASEPQRSEILRLLASHTDAGVRQHFFELLGQHRRLLPPGAISTNSVTAETWRDILRCGATDPVAKVRERAVASAFGMNLVRLIRDETVACVDDAEMDTRQYAIVALGTLDDPATLALLKRKLTTGTDPEIASAISALARRPDGIEDALALATDPRPWVHDELVGAIARVSAPLTEAQLAGLAATLPHPGLADAITAHRRRVAPGGREYGPDGDVFVVRAPTPNPEP